MSGSGGEIDEEAREEANQLLSGTGMSVEDLEDSWFQKLAAMWGFLNSPNRYGYSLFGSPFAFIISTIAALIVSIITGAWKWVLDFVVALSWPFEDMIWFFIDQTYVLGEIVAVPVMEAVRQYNAMFRDIAMEAGAAAPIVLIGMYVATGAVVYVAFTTFVPYGRAIDIARRVI